MAYVSAVEGYAAAGSVIPYDSAHSNSVGVPEAELLFRGEFQRVGPDLVLTGQDGRHHVVPGYFSTEHRPALVAPNGASLSGDLVALLAGSPTPGEYAQVQPTTSPDVIGKIEKVVGNVTVLRNGVSVALNVGDSVYKSDVIQTGADSAVGVSFPDSTALQIVANTRLVLNDYSYDPSSTSNVALFSLVEGTFAFVAGAVAHTGDMKMVTPVATMGIRGTTGYVLESTLGNLSTYQFVVTDDYGTTHHGQYDLFSQNGTVMATVSQTEFVTECTSTSCTTQPMSASQLAFAQQITQQVFDTLNQGNGPTPHTNPGNGGSSTPPNDIPYIQPLPQLHDQGTTPFTINVPINVPTSPIEPVTITISQPPPPAPSHGWVGDTLVEYYYFPSFGTNFYTSPTFTAPASGIVGFPSAPFSFSVDSTSITAVFTGGGAFTLGPFNGFEIADVSGNPLISGVTIDPTTDMPGLTISDISFDSTAVWVNWVRLTFSAGTVVKLDLTFDPPLNPAQLSVTQTLDGSVSPAHNDGTLTVADGTELALAGIVDNTGTILVDATSTATAIEINGNVTLQGGGHIELSENNQNYIFGSDATLTNVDNTISGGGDLGNGTLIFHNEGVVEAIGPYALIIDTGSNPVVNTGTLETDGSTLMVQSPVTGGGNAIIAGGTLEFFDASDNNVIFTGSNLSVLALDQSQSYTGHIFGFSGPDQIDLGDITFSATTSLDYTANASHTGGTLTVSDGTDTANIALVGSYTASSFTLSSDGHGGALITDVAPANVSSGPPVGPSDADVANGTITLTDSDSSNTQTASFTPEGSGNTGTFSLDPVSVSGGSVSVGWEFSLDNDQINLATGATVTQAYGVSVTDPQNPALEINQTVSVSLGGPGNDSFVFAPGIGAETIANFNPQNDTIELNGFSNIHSEQQLASLITNDAHGDAVIALGHNDSITLPGMSPAELQAVLQSAVHLH